jgi:AcrR family transcriptional regulator
MTVKPPAPKFRRRKTDRPGEIVAAAQAVFAERGFAAARLDEIAARAGVSKGALYLYFETKEDLFRAVVHDAVSPRINAMAAMISSYDGPFAELARMALPRAAQVITESGAGAVVKMVVGESRNFPELAKVWHDEVIAKGLGAISGQIEKAQARGEVRPGDPRTHAFSLMGPIFLGVVWTETFTPIGGTPVDVVAVARQHVETVLGGLLAEPRS